LSRRAAWSAKWGPSSHAPASPEPRQCAHRGDRTSTSQSTRGNHPMTSRLRGLGYVLGIIGLAFVVAGGFAFMKVQEGSASLASFSAAQNVALTYNEDGQLIDRGTTEGADAIMALLAEEWNYPVVAGELDPKDPIVDTASEY